MSKDFEAEYRAYQNQSAPDLWSRIEAEIDAEIAAQEEQKSDSQKIVKFPVWKMATIVAACFAVIICIPSLGIMMLVSGGSKTCEETATADCTTSVECETACEAEESESYVDSEMDYMTDDVVTEAQTESMVETEDEWGYDLNGIVTDGAAEKTILDINIVKLEDAEDEQGFCYTAINVETEEEITVIQIAETASMKEGETYTILAVKNDESTYYFEALVVE